MTSNSHVRPVYSEARYIGRSIRSSPTHGDEVLRLEFKENDGNKVYVYLGSTIPPFFIIQAVEAIRHTPFDRDLHGEWSISQIAHLLNGCKGNRVVIGTIAHEKGNVWAFEKPKSVMSHRIVRAA